MRDIDDTKAPLLEHLIELRRRLLYSLVVLVVLFFGSLYFAKTIFAFLVQPLIAAGQGKIIYTDIFEAFFAEVKVALFAALMIGFPFFATQMWKFVAPGLYVKEKKALLPFLLLTPFFFIGGAAFAYFVAMPWALHFLLSFQGDVGGIQREALPGVGNYLSFCTRFLFGFGVAFLTPILLMILERAGIVTLKQLTGSRRYALVASARDLCSADAAGRGLDDATARAALFPLRTGDHRHSPHALAPRPQGSDREVRRASWKK